MPESDASDLQGEATRPDSAVAKEQILNFVRAIAALISVSPLCAQYGGPAILARGQSPGTMSATQIDFRPFISLMGTYDTGLNGVAVDANGAPVNDASYGVSVNFGISGFHSWKHTRIGLDYSGGFSHYAKAFYDGINAQSLQLSISHQLSRHISASLSNSAVLYGSNHSTPTLPSTLEFDPATTYVPTNDFFDNRTIALSSQANLAIQRSTRLSFMIGVDGFLTRRRSSALFGNSGIGAHGDLQYRISRRTTVGVVYGYMHYSFSGIYGSTDSHTLAGTYSVSISRSLQFSALAGVARYENVFVEIVPIDPAIAAVIGVSSAQRVSYQKNYMPNIGARLSKVVPRGTVVLSVSNAIDPGNGLFLTSTSFNAGLGYSYTGLRRWAISAGVNYNRSISEGNVLGDYGDYTANLTASRQILPLTHGVLSLYARKYDSPDFKNYNKWSYGMNLGVSFTPGDVPVRLW
jgi:hypothetical protein